MGVFLEPSFDKVFDTQKIYRLMLDAMARPGKIIDLPCLDICPPSGLSGYAAGLAFTLLDAETTFAVLPADALWQDYLAVNTGAKPAVPAAAEFILLTGQRHAPEIAEANRGSLLAPEGGATLFILVGGIAADAGSIKLTLTGPGVDGQATVMLEGLILANLESILSLNSEYPLGVDCFFVDRRGRLFAIPRSTSVNWEVAA